MKILITGGSGYFGSLIIPELLKSDWVEIVVNLDEKARFFKSEKYFLVQKNLLDDFREALRDFGQFDAILHLAYKIRRPYFRKNSWAKENIESSQRIFQFALENGVKKFIHASTVAVYGALPENNLNKKSREIDNLPDWPYDYAQNKKAIEELLTKLWYDSQKKISLIVLRIASVAGPHTRQMKKMGLFNFLKSFWPILIYVREDSGRQYLHEKDLVSAFIFLLQKDFQEKFLIFNLAPRDFLTFKEIARLTKKIALKLPYHLLKIIFSLFWHISLGKIPTPPYAIDSFAFPIYVDGSKIEEYGFRYRYSSKETYLSDKEDMIAR